MASRPQTHLASVRGEAEKNLGIIQRASAINFSFTGEIRKRYTDFLVNELRKDGTTVHLWEFFEAKPHVPEQQRPTTTEFPKPAAKVQPPPTIEPISDEDQMILESLVGGSADNLITFDKAIQGKEPLIGDKRQVELESITDKDLRSKIHQEIRRIFSGRIETVAASTGVITATAARWALTRGNRGTRGGRGGNNAGPGRRDNRGRDQSFAQLGGDYLHFTLYKENKDTMDAINTIARLLKIKASNFGFAGTKDRRAGTVQRVSVHKQRANNLDWLNTRLPNVKIGDYSYHNQPLQLGQHGGNEFIITIKNCRNLGDAGCSVQQRARMVQESVEFALAYMIKHGYINYFGLQRFGTYSIGTHMLGMKLLNDDFAGAVDDILYVNEQYLQEVLDHQHQSSRDDYHRAKAVTTWKLTGNAEKALEVMPKRFSSEIALIRHLGRNKNDFLGAILGITRGMRMMYIHAYQSYVWNFVATYRWSRYGPNVVEGDLVLVDGRKDEDLMDLDVASDDDDEHFYAEARPLTEEDVASGKYTIFDVILPTPGYDVIYPRNDVGDYYVSFMAKPENGKLNPYEMRRRNKEFSLSGNYRHLLGRFIGEPQYAIRMYSNDNDQMHPTDLDLCNSRKAAAKASAPAMADATATRWANFTRNVQHHDDAVREDRRRKASLEPPQGDIVTKETWVQTGLDGAAKRVKITRERHTETQTADATERPDETMASPEGTATDSPKWLAPPQVSERPQNEVPSFPSSASIVVNAEDFTNPDDKVSTLQQLSADIANSEAPYTGVIGQERGQDAGVRQIGLDDAEGWMDNVMAKLPDVMASLAGPRPGSSSSKSSVEPKVSSVDPTDNVEPNVSFVEPKDNNTNGNGEQPSTEAITVPEFYSPSINPILSMNGKIDQTRPDAEKIAVVLKFRLKTSNYATVVLRELMGANASIHA